MTEELLTFKAEKIRTDAFLRELQDRVERAEMEIKINDEIDLKILDFNDVQIELKLKKQIVKQRHEIVQKGLILTLLLILCPHPNPMP